MRINLNNPALARRSPRARRTKALRHSSALWSVVREWEIDYQRQLQDLNAPETDETPLQ